MKPVHRLFVNITFISFILVIGLTKSNPPKNYSSDWTTFSDANNITDLSIDQNGFVWAASTGGITKWDPNTTKYERFTTMEGLPTNNISTILADKDGSIWVGTPNGVIARLVGNQWVKYEIPELSTSMAINDIYQDTKGNIWFATYGAGAIRYDDKNWRVFLLEDGIASVVVHRITEDDSGNLWFDTYLPCCMNLDDENIHDIAGTINGEKAGISRFDGKNWKIYNNEFGLDNEVFFGTYTNLAANGNDIWVAPFGEDMFIGKLSENELKQYPYKTLGFSSVTKILSDINGNVWFSLWGEKGVVKFDGTKWLPFTTNDGLINNFVTAMVAGTDGSMWFGTTQGISRLINGKWLKYITKDVQSSLPYYRNLFDLAIDSNGNPWLATDHGVYNFNGKRWINYSPNNGLPTLDVRNIEITTSNIVWIRAIKNNWVDEIYSFDGKVWIKHNNPFSRDWFVDFSPDASYWIIQDDNKLMHININQVISEFPTHKNSFVESIAITHDGQIWIINYQDLFQFNGQDWTAQNIEYQNSAITLSPEGEIWIASDAKPNIDTFYELKDVGINIFKYTGNDFEVITTLPGNGWVNKDTMVFSTDGSLWLGRSGGGAYQYINGEWIIFTTQDGLADNYIEMIRTAPDGSIWFVTNGGLSHYTGTIYK